MNKFRQLLNTLVKKEIGLCYTVLEAGHVEKVNGVLVEVNDDYFEIEVKSDSGHSSRMAINVGAVTILSLLYSEKS